MAEKKTSVKYKFGQKELDMDRYLKNIGSNVQSYLEDRRKRGWTDDLVQEFSTAYNRYMNAFKQLLTDNSTRFSTDDLGNIIDANGEFNNIDNDDNNGTQYYYNDKGERITNTDYDALKDKKKGKYKTFNANRLVAEYFRTIGKAMETAKPTEDEKFNLSKHGFVSWWSQKYNPNGGAVNLKPFLDKDPVGADGKRPVSNRAKMAAGWMNEYLDWLEGKNLDFSNYEQFGDFNNYATKGRELAQKWNDGVWDSDDLIAGQAFGIGNDWSNGFFTTEEDPNLTPELRAALEAEAKQKEEQAKSEQITKNKQAWIDLQIAAFNGSSPTWTRDNPYNSTFDRTHWYNDDGSVNLENYYNAWGANFLGADGKPSVPKLDSYMNEFVQNPFDAKYKNDIARNIVGLIQSGAAQPISGGDLEGMYYIPSRSDEQHNRALVFDPSTNSLFYTFIGDIPAQWKRRTDKWNLDNGITQPGSKYMFEEGGVIETMQLGGNFGNSFVEGRNNYVKGKADAQGLSVEQYEARNRRPGGDKTALEQNNGFTGNDILRLTAIGTDLAAMGLSFTPAIGASSITGAAGTTQHLIADINEDGFDWGDVGRAALGYGLDALGLIPGVSGVTKPIKIAKSLAKFVPKLIAVVGTAGVAANSPAIIASLKKLGSDESLTVQDWQNITSAVTLAVGGGAAAGRKYHTYTGKGNYNVNPTLVGNAVRGRVPGLVGRNTETGNFAIQVRKKGTTDTENIILTKAESEAVKGKSNDEILKVIQQRPGMADYELATSQSLLPSVSFRENGKWKLSAGFRDKAATLMPIRRDQRTGEIYAENGRWGADIDRAHMSAVSKGQHQAIQQTRADDAAIGNLDVVRDAARASRGHLALLDAKPGREANLTRVRDLAQQDIDAYKAANAAQPASADVQAKMTALDSRIKAIEAIRARSGRNPSQYTVRKAQHVVNGQKMTALQNELTTLKGELSTLQTAATTARGSAKTAAKRKIDAKKAEITTKEQEIQNLQRTLDTDKKWLQDNGKTNLSKLRTEYTSHLTQLSASQAYERGLEPFLTRFNKAEKLLGQLRGITDAKGQTEAFKRLEAMRDPGNTTIKFTITDPSGTNRVVTRNWDDVLSKYGIVYKGGGKFDFVRAFQSGGQIRNVQGQANWFDHMYKHQSMQNWLGTWNTLNYENFNKLQDSWFTNLLNTKYNPNDPSQAMGEGDGMSQGVYNRQAEWNKTGTNAAIKDLNTLGILKGNGGTNDKTDTFQDGYFGAQEYLRHGGTNVSWFGHEEDLQALIEAFKKVGLNYAPDENGMYKLSPLKPGEVPNQQAVINDPSVNPNGDTGEGNSTTNPEGDTGNETGDNTGNKEPFQLGKFHLDPKILSIAHNTYANSVNDRMTARQIDALRKGVVLRDLKHNTKYLLGNFDALMAGEKAAGQMYHLASQPMTADGQVQTAAYLDSAAKAQDYIIQGKTLNNEALRKKAEEIWKLRYDDDAFNYDVAMTNRETLGNLVENIANLESARDAKNYTNNDVLWQELMYGIKQKNAKKEVLEDSFARSDIHNEVYYNLKKYVPTLSTDEEEAWNAVVSGDKQFSELGGDDPEAKKRLQRAYMSAARKASEAEQNKLRSYYGVSPNKYASVRSMATPTFTPTIEKEGGVLFAKDGAAKIAVAKIRERQRDADRFHKVTKDKHDRVDKAIARVDKKMYGRTKADKRRK